ncbi:MAG: gluconate 2-dehydrogenase subunit 3 family protein [Bryobacteraceae bacterium]
MSRWNPRRRRFLGAAAVAAAAPGMVSCTGKSSPWRTLSDAEARAAEAVCECLIPTDEFPGAAWAGAVHYIDRQLAGHLGHLRETYRRGLAMMDAAARGQGAADFAALAADRRVELLKAVEKGKAAAAGWNPAEQRAFFSAILANTMQSFYGDPRHGGNRDGIGYRMLGIPLTPVRGREGGKLA